MMMYSMAICGSGSVIDNNIEILYIPAEIEMEGEWRFEILFLLYGVS